MTRGEEGRGHRAVWREPAPQRSPGGLIAARSLASGHLTTLPVDHVSAGGGPGPGTPG